MLAIFIPNAIDEKRNVSHVRSWDLLLGTGTVGIELQNYGFKNIVATDYCEEMLEVAGKKGSPDGVIYLHIF